MQDPQQSKAAGRAGAPLACGPGVTAYLFKRESVGQYCLSRDRSGCSIPPGFNGEAWVYVRELVLAQGERAILLDTDLALEELARVGYHLIGCWYDDE